MENPTPAAISVMKLARNNRFWPATALSAGALKGQVGLFSDFCSATGTICTAL